MERWQFERRFVSFSDIDKEYGQSVTLAINELIKHHVLGDAISYIRERIQIAQRLNNSKK